ncbi:MAG: radical SAM protein [Bacilli bacterium]|nr:radical SAM protein [Bacilli bacterium]
MLLRAKTKTLFEGKPLTEKQKENTDLNLKEIDENKVVLDSYPRRLVLELTNACNLNCVMCGRNAADFKLTSFDMDIFKSLEPLFDTIEEVTLMGWGEPTIHPNFLEMLEIINKHSARKYFCTNGMTLDKIKNAIFDYKVDVFAVSLDGATYETNKKIRRGSDLNKIVANLKEIVKIKKERNLTYPYINFVFCAMKSNIEELPDLVKLASDVGVDEVKVVYLTAFNKLLAHEVLWDEKEKTKEIFNKAEEIADKLNISLKLPYLIGEDPAKDKAHKDCYVAWRDFFVGSDDYIRPCMSTNVEFFKYNKDVDFKTMWNDKKFIEYREKVNTENMDKMCRHCYQSSFCNWNKKHSFIQIDESFSPDWNK